MDKETYEKNLKRFLEGLGNDIIVESYDNFDLMFDDIWKEDRQKSSKDK